MAEILVRDIRMNEGAEEIERTETEKFDYSASPEPQPLGADEEEILLRKLAEVAERINVRLDRINATLEGMVV